MTEALAEQPAVTPRRRRGRRRRRRGSAICYAGFDLSTTTDLTAYVLAAPQYGADESETIVSVFPRFYLPAAGILRKEREDKVPYRRWADDGFLTLTDGDTIDYAHIRKDFYADAERVHIHRVLIDPHNASEFTQHLQEEGFDVLTIRQSAQQMGPLTKEVERLILEQRLRHPDHPVLNWHVSNCALRRDTNDNAWPVKTDAGKSIKGQTGRRRFKVDGAIAMIMAAGYALMDPDKPRMPRRARAVAA